MWLMYDEPYIDEYVRDQTIFWNSCAQPNWYNRSKEDIENAIINLHKTIHDDMGFWSDVEEENRRYLRYLEDKLDDPNLSEKERQDIWDSYSDLYKELNGVRPH